MRNIRICVFICVAMLFGACANVDESGTHSASYWYEKMLLSIANGNLERADNYYNALQSEHIASPLIHESLILLTKAHMDNGEHLLAGFFANEYKIRYSNVKNVDYIAFLGAESTYYAFSNYTKNQGFINDNVGELNNFVALNPRNKYLPYIRHILTSFRLAQLEVNNEIIRIYKLQDKDIAVEKYTQDNESLGLEDIEFKPSHIPWYVKMFSW